MRKNIQEIIAASYIMLPDINFLVIVFLLHIKQSKAQRFIEDSGLINKRGNQVTIVMHIN